MSQRAAQPASGWTLACRDATLARGHRIILRNITLELNAGQCVCLIGPNGAGKSTLMLGLLGLLRPLAGRITLDDHELWRTSERNRGRFAAYVPQLSQELPGFSVFDVVATGRFPHLRPLEPLSAADRGIIDEAIARCGLADLASRAASELSAGERQKTLLASALAQDPQALFLDEPDTALDPAVEIELTRLLRNWRDSGRTLVYISHDLMLPAILGGRIVALRDGEVVADGPAEEILTAGRLESIYRAPFTEAMLPDGSRVLVPRWT